MSFIARVFRNILSGPRYVGRDLEGNLFYERPKFGRRSRFVEYRNPEDVWSYIGGGKRLPVQWSAWLTYSREHPPTLEELQADLERQQRVLANVKLIEARNREERAEMLQLQASAPHIPGREPQPADHPSSTSRNIPESLESEQGQSKPSPKMVTTRDSFEPQPWTPRVKRAGGH